MRISLRWSAGLATAAAILMIGAGIDLWGPRSHDLRAFEPVKVARLETAMWRSYYDRDRIKLFGELAALLRTQYGLPPLRSLVTAYRAAHAATVFQRGRGRTDYQRALPDLERFYKSIGAVSVQPLDAVRAARLELEWWIIHRERATHPPEDLPRALAALQAELYHEPPDAFVEHAQERAAAMLVRDSAAEGGRPTEAQWETIGRLLERSWTLLWQTVQKQTT